MSRAMKNIVEAEIKAGDVNTIPAYVDALRKQTAGGKSTGNINSRGFTGVDPVNGLNTAGLANTIAVPLVLLAERAATGESDAAELLSTIGEYANSGVSLAEDSIKRRNAEKMAAEAGYSDVDAFLKDFADFKSTSRKR